jgi:1-acyl-sn-glycerol-3-phosphate acyltransferase
LNRTAPAKRSLKSRLFWPVVIPSIKIGSRLLWGLRVDRGPGFPDPPFVLAANHYSFLDPPLVGAAAYGKRARFIALIDLYGNHWPLDWALDALDVITVRRGTVPLGTVRACLAHLDEGGVVGVFPEGIRVNTFGEAGFKRGAAWLAVKRQVPLVAVAVIGSDRVLGVDNVWHGGRIRLVVGPTLHPTGTDNTAVDDLLHRWAQWVGHTLTSP